MFSKPNVLVVYGAREYPLRESSKDRLYCYKRYAKAKCFYYSVEDEPPSYLQKINFDLIIFECTLAAHRWHGADLFKDKIYPKIAFTRESRAAKVVLPQDEWIQTNLLNDFINDFQINYVFSVAPESEWKKIYNRIDFNKVRFFKSLTGYLDESTLKKITTVAKTIRKRDIDIGYRAYRAPSWLGRHGYLKTKIAHVFREQASCASLKTDISVEEKDTIYGDAWYKFMLRCKYSIGAEGGSSVLDEDGNIWRRGTEFKALYPNATFEETEAACFSGMDGNLNLTAISPRHLEACATRTCQVLIEGEYNAILKPNIHYIELKKDFSNVEQVLELIKDDRKRESMVENAYRDIVISGRYTYHNFVEYMINNTLIKNDIKLQGVKEQIYIWIVYLINSIHDWVKWQKSRCFYALRPYLNMMRQYNFNKTKGIFSYVRHSRNL